MLTLAITLTVEDLLKIPFDGCNYLLNQAEQKGQLSLILVRTLYDAECKGKARWPVMNNLRRLMNTQLTVGCAVCDRGDHQLGHADGCPNSTH